MPEYLSNDHIIIRNTSPPGAPLAEWKPDFPENADFLHVLAAAQAENGEFEKAVETARKGLKLAEVAKNGNLAEMIRHCIGQYKRGRSIRSN